MLLCTTRGKPTVDATTCTHAATIVGGIPYLTMGYLLALASPRDTVIAYDLPLEGTTRVQSTATFSRTYLLPPQNFERLPISYTAVAPAN